MVLFKNGMDINQTDHKGRTALELMSFKGNRIMVEWLLASGADINHVSR